LPDGVNDPAVEVPVAEPTIEYGEAWEFHINPQCNCTDPLQQVPHLAVKGNKVMRVTGPETLQQWITMCLATDRFRWEIYNNQYGTEFAQLIESSVPEDEAESEVIRVIREAILVDPRVASVTSVRVTPGRDVGNPSAFIAEVRVVTYTGELRLLQLDLSLIRTINAYLDT
jgi:hypothetical protein